MWVQILLEAVLIRNFPDHATHARASCTMPDRWGWAQHLQGYGTDTSRHGTPNTSCRVVMCPYTCMPCFYNKLWHVSITHGKIWHLGCSFTIIQYTMPFCDVSLHMHAVSEFCKIIVSSYNCLVYASTNHSDSSLTQQSNIQLPHAHFSTTTKQRIYHKSTRTDLLLTLKEVELLMFIRGLPRISSASFAFNSSSCCCLSCIHQKK